jgi:hypothetical protein
VADDALRGQIAALLATAGLAPDGLRLEPLATGGNNRVFSVTAGDRKLVAKRYFRHPSDPRDRLGTEYDFLTYAHAAGVTCVPRPIARDDAAGTALYEFIVGEPLVASRLGRGHVEQARDFFVGLNRAQARPLGARLPCASESCFSINEQLALVQRRVDRLATIPGTSADDTRARAFVSELGERWSTLRRSVIEECGRRGWDPSEPLDPADRCVSPSDFGFHNALTDADGRVTFLDFEYAGWDDPAKAVSDFFAHPGVPVPDRDFDGFLSAAVTYSPRAASLEARTRLMRPVFQMKWCCIVMNVFLPAELARRKFADPLLQEEDKKRTQLEKAHRLLQLVEI